MASIGQKQRPVVDDFFVFHIFMNPYQVQDKIDNLRKEVQGKTQTLVRKSAETFVEQLYQHNCINSKQRWLFARSQKHTLEEAGLTYVNKVAVKTRINWSWNEPKDERPKGVSDQASAGTEMQMNFREVVLAEKLWGRIMPLFCPLYDVNGDLVCNADDITAAKKVLADRLRRANIVV